jgi:predicted transposase/invertase (TIGR01784 family)
MWNMFADSKHTNLIKMEYPHDVFAKEIFSKKELFATLLEHFCPKDIINTLDLTSLVPTDTVALTPEMREIASDIAYTCNLRDGRSATLVLLENKTHIPKFPHLQLHEYQGVMWTKSVKKKSKKLPVIIPILLYHGKRPWPKKPFADYFGPVPECLKMFLPVLNYILIDLSKILDDEILKLPANPVKNALLLMKHCYDSSFLENNTDILFIHGHEYLKNDENRRILEAIFLYFGKVSQFSPTKLIKIVNQKIDPIMRKAFRSTYDMAMEDGMEKGIQKGMEEGMEKGMEKGMELKEREMILACLLRFPLMTNEEIAEFVRTKVEMVLTVRAELENKN